MRQPVAAMALLVMVVAACAKKLPPVTGAAGQPVPSDVAGAPAPPPPAPTRPAQPVADNLPVPLQPAGEDAIEGRSLDDLNRDSPLRPVFFPLDAFELDAEARSIASANAEILKRYPGWMITLEGHCDERGTAEYNLALGERRAIAVRTYLVSLGIAADRIRTVSYGKEFPFDPGHTEDAWAKNRRAHFVITAR